MMHPAELMSEPTPSASDEKMRTIAIAKYDETVKNIARKCERLHQTRRQIATELLPDLQQRLGEASSTAHTLQDLTAASHRFLSFCKEIAAEFRESDSVSLLTKTAIYTTFNDADAQTALGQLLAPADDDLQQLKTKQESLKVIAVNLQGLYKQTKTIAYQLNEAQDSADSVLEQLKDLNQVFGQRLVFSSSP